eukprot:1475083-Alexandrium_andersonii.AAC.1
MSGCWLGGGGGGSRRYRRLVARTSRWIRAASGFRAHGVLMLRACAFVQETLWSCVGGSVALRAWRSRRRLRGSGGV